MTVAFEHGRWRHAGWAAFGVIAGGFLVWKLGVVGKGVGAVLIAIGAYNAFRFVRTLLHPAGERYRNHDAHTLAAHFRRPVTP